MKDPQLSSEDELAALLAQGREIRPVSAQIRARLLARARAVVNAPGSLHELEPLPPPRVRPLAYGAAAAAALAVGVAGAVTAGYLQEPSTPAPPTSSAPDTAVPRPRWTGHTLLTAPPAPAAVPALPPLSSGSVVDTAPPNSRPPAPLALQESYAAELELLRHAQSSYAARDYSGALAKLADHAKRFPNGRLAEEREALRVRSLASAGRMDAARSAVAAFAKRFPRSVLLPRLEQVVGSTPAK